MARPGSLLLALMLGVAVLLPAQEAPSSAPRSGFQGLSLTEALLELERRGLELVFSSTVVRPTMRVEQEPAAETLRSILAELLAEHGLEAWDGAAGRLIVVPKADSPELAVISGAIFDRRSGTPLAGARVVLGGSEREAVSDPDGRFSFPEVAPGSYTLSAELSGFLPQLHRLELSRDSQTEVRLELTRPVLTLEEEVVSRPLIDLDAEQPTRALRLERTEAEQLPRPGDDWLGAVSLMPGAASAELSAELSVRGGHENEVAVVLDGLEIYEPYHLRDLNSALSIVASQTVASSELLTSGAPAAYGDRLGGLLDLTTIDPGWRLRTELGLSFIDAHGIASGRLPGDRGAWIAAGRLGTLDRAAELLDRRETPSFWDAFAKVSYDLSASHRLEGRRLQANDALGLEQHSGTLLEEIDTRYRSSYTWIGHQSVLGDSILAQSLLSFGEAERMRNGRKQDLQGLFTLRDVSTLDLFGLRTDWSLQPGAKHTLSLGLSSRLLSSEFDYASDLLLEDPLAGIRSRGAEDRIRFIGQPHAGLYSLYASERLKALENLTVELGVRYDRSSLVERAHLSPRLSLAYRVGRRSTVRLSLGRFYQSQRPYELAVEDGETTFAPDERADELTVGLEYRLDSGLSLRLDGYGREIRSSRLRYDNLFDPVTTFPELEPDRVAIAPDSATSRGVEVLVRSRPGQRVAWSLSYAYANVFDRVGEARVPRTRDQRHTYRAQCHLPLPAGWQLGAAWIFHTGWPTTPITAELTGGGTDEARILPKLGPLRSDRLPDYHRLDLRLSRRWNLERGELTFYADLLNAYGRTNVRGYRIDLRPRLDGAVDVLRHPKQWGGVIPALGVKWSF